MYNVWPKCLDILIIHIAYKKNQHILFEGFRQILVWGYGNILDPKNLVGCYTKGINSSLIFFLNTLHYLNLLPQAIGLT